MRLNLSWRLVVLVCGFTDVVVPSHNLAASQANSGSIAGVLLDHQSRKPLAGARISVAGTPAAAESNTRGIFELGPLPAGVYELLVERLGYERRLVRIELRAGVTVEVEIDVTKQPIELPPIVVAVRSDYLVNVGFYERRDYGGLKGYFLTRADIDRRTPRGLTDLLEDMSGVRVVYLEPGKRTVRFNRHVSADAAGGRKAQSALQRAANPLDQRGCEPDLYVDGHRYRNATAPIITDRAGVHFGEALNKVDNFDVVSVVAVEAMEVYVGAATPLQYSSSCGVILVWTRRGVGL